MGLFKKKKESALQELPSFGEDNHSRKEKGCFRRWYREKPWIFRGLAVSMAFAVVPYFSSTSSAILRYLSPSLNFPQEA